MDSTTGRAGVIRASDGDGSMDKLAHSVLDDLLYNIISDLVLETHREEKLAKATTAAIQAEKVAADASDPSAPEIKPDVRIETDAAIYHDGKVYLKGNPLKTTKEILCPKCHLPRLLHPTDGKGAKKPDPTVLYCKRHPYIEKAGCDVYGQSWVGPGPGRGKKKKDMEKKDEAGAGGEQRPPNVLSFPSATCSKCKRCILVTRLNNHMGSCIGNSGRNASRAASQKFNNGNGNINSSTPPPTSSQKNTPAPGSRAASPRKREMSEDLDDENNSNNSNNNNNSNHNNSNNNGGGGGHGADGTGPPKKKKMKSSASASASGTSTPPGSINAKKVILKTKKELAKAAASGLSQEKKFGRAGSADSDSVEVATHPAKSKTGNGSPLKKSKIAKPPAHNSSPLKNGRDADGESESSGTLSSPRQ
ncbi:Transcriptional activator (PtaC) [Geosmithia morbida]|uniref:Transcriptional activator (PtaC) n=1 Tax=Geosmithia morbida TaxID=1094350 RepID=A0A9P4Z010_9HYPO|nr:Transcriptional activator (PtaC) [Geosmithia morbida]KAF4124768.1 Transcriptional activator (PtaC) [Geosmithia morbida]